MADVVKTRTPVKVLIGIILTGLVASIALGAWTIQGLTTQVNTLGEKVNTQRPTIWGAYNLENHACVSLGLDQEDIKLINSKTVINGTNYVTKLECFTEGSKHEFTIVSPVVNWNKVT